MQRGAFCIYEVLGGVHLHAPERTSAHRGMGSHARRSIDTSIVSQSRVQLIQCQQVNVNRDCKPLILALTTLLIKSSRFDHAVYIRHLVRHWDSSAANQACVIGRYSSGDACTPKQGYIHDAKQLKIRPQIREITAMSDSSHSIDTDLKQKHYAAI